MGGKVGARKRRIDTSTSMKKKTAGDNRHGSKCNTGETNRKRGRAGTRREDVGRKDDWEKQFYYQLYEKIIHAFRTQTGD
jgi:hypothetical protein